MRWQKKDGGLRLRAKNHQGHVVVLLGSGDKGIGGVHHAGDYFGGT